jgi:protein gp37
MDPTWARQLRDQCADTGINFFMKQMTGKRSIPADLMVRQIPGGH